MTLNKLAVQDAVVWDITDEESAAFHESRNQVYSGLQNDRRCLQDNADGLMITASLDSKLKESMSKRILQVNVFDCLSKAITPPPEVAAQLPEMLEHEKKTAEAFRQMAENATGNLEPEMQHRMSEAAKRARLTASYMEKVVAIRRIQSHWPK